MAATSPVNSIWTGKTTRLGRLSSHRPGVLLSCELVVAWPHVVLSLRRPLVVLSRQLVVASPLAVLSLRCTLVVLSRRSSLFLVLSCTHSHPGSHSQPHSCFHAGSCPCFMTWWYGLNLIVTFIKIPNK